MSPTVPTPSIPDTLFQSETIQQTLALSRDIPAPPPYDIRTGGDKRIPLSRELEGKRRLMK